MDTMLDLQLFAEETEGTETTQQPEEATQQTDTPDQPKEEIPEELEGLPEEAAREAMEEAKQERTPEPAESDNSDNKPNEGSHENNIPYPRFKEVIDQKNAMAAELEAYRAKYGNIASTGTQQQAAPPKQTEPPRQAEAPSQVGGMPAMQFTPEISAKIEEAVNQQALQMIGMSAEDVASLEEYGEEDDPKLKMIANAKAMARNYIMGEITEAVRQQQAQRTAYIRQHQNMVDDYNAFVQRESAEPDFKEVQQFAVGAFFEQLPAVDQAALRDAYARTEQQAATPQDIMLVKRYFADAKAAFHRGKTQAPAPQKAAPKAQKPSLPRAAEMDGSAATPSQGITNESIAKMLDTMDVDELPESVKKLLEG